MSLANYVQLVGMVVQEFEHIRYNAERMVTICGPDETYWAKRART
jgi:hypothetical protein